MHFISSYVVNLTRKTSDIFPAFYTTSWKSSLFFCKEGGGVAELLRDIIRVVTYRLVA